MATAQQQPENDGEIRRALLYSDDMPGKIFEAEVIRWQDKWWLVSMWTASPLPGLKRPVRIAHLDPLPHQIVPSGTPADFVLQCSIPKAFFEPQGQTEPWSGLVVVEAPPIQVPTDPVH